MRCTRCSGPRRWLVLWGQPYRRCATGHGGTKVRPERYPYPVRPSSFYGRAKMLAEQVLLMHAGQMKVVILRPTFIWGEDSLQLHDLIDRARKGNLPWFDDGESLFEHVYVDKVELRYKLSVMFQQGLSLLAVDGAAGRSGLRVDRDRGFMGFSQTRENPLS
ncbi:NAD-dependent epimerase/dehydratase family protein [Kyrpidia sp.]|uniref:NAD-dependent epimerase/dehydratase family protein n=1 Tax=Kyrpidia sp. TaxID=2073077 RepID=UPI00338ECC96